MSQHLTRSRECLRRVAAWTVVLGALQLMASAPARACTCLSLFDAVMWPADGSTVSADTAIVIRASRSLAPIGPYVVTLRAPDGTEIALEQVAQLPKTYVCDDDMFFLRPEPELLPGMTYEVTVKASAEGPTEVVKFATREKSARPNAARKPEVTYLSVEQHPDCESGECFDLAEVRVELTHALPELTWLQIRSESFQSPVNRWVFSPETVRSPADVYAQDYRMDGDRVARLSVRLPPNDLCLDIAIYGIDGLPLFEERRCQPDRCAVYKSRQHPACGEPPYTGLDPTRVPPMSCEDPPVLVNTKDYPEYDAGTEQEAKDEDEVRLRRRPAPDCHVSPPSAANTAGWPAVLVAAASAMLVRRRQRRRGRTTGCARRAPSSATVSVARSDGPINR